MPSLARLKFMMWFCTICAVVMTYLMGQNFFTGRYLWAGLDAMIVSLDIWAALSLREAIKDREEWEALKKAVE